MKRFLQWLSGWWFATMTPTSALLTTIEAREALRKRHLLSLILLMGLLGATFSLAQNILIRSSWAYLVQVLVWIGFMLVSLWINSCGYLKSASLFYLLGSFAGLAAELVTFSLTLAMSTFYFWSLLLILPVAAGLFLPAWGPLLLGGVEGLFLAWFVLFERQSQIAHYLTQPEQFAFLCIIGITLMVIAGFSALSSATTKRAVVQADRANELELLHQALSQTHAGLEAAYATIQKQALTDGLTGLPNHRAIMDQLTKELERTQRYHRPFSLLFFDADHFKQINDTYGHATGDTVLQQIGQRASMGLRGSDTLGRIGGEEFVILLPETEAAEARIIAERIRVAIKAKPFATTDVAENLTMTVSIGCSSYQLDSFTEQGLLSQADEAMYAAKQLGRNQVCSAADARKLGADIEILEALRQENLREAIQTDEIKPEQLRDTYTLRLIRSLLSLLNRRDERLPASAHSVSDLAATIGEKMGLEPTLVAKIRMATLVHDIGFLALPDRLLQMTGIFSPQERTLMREHVTLGAQLLDASPFLRELAPSVRHHHEHWDGHGYPDQMRGEEIPLPARIIAVAEAFYGMQQDRSYRASCSTEEAVLELQRCAGTQFDPTVVQALVSLQKRQSQDQALPFQRVG